jgi:hypothetical protein
MVIRKYPWYKISSRSPYFQKNEWPPNAFTSLACSRQHFGKGAHQETQTKVLVEAKLMSGGTLLANKNNLRFFH